MEEVTRSKGQRMLVSSIEPQKCIIDNLEVLAFENEEQLNFYTVWHEALFDKRRELNAESEREKQIIRNEIARKTRQLIGSGADEDVPRSKKSKSRSSNSKSSSARDAPLRSSPKKLASSSSLSSPPKVAATSPIRPTPVSPTSNVGGLTVLEELPINSTPGSQPRPTSTAKISKPKHIAHGSQPLPPGLVLHNSSVYGYNTLPDGKKLLRYKLNKMYNKYRGRQIRRNHVNEKQRNAKIDVEVRKSYLTPWTAYCALQALRLPPELTSGMYVNGDPNVLAEFNLKRKKKKKKPLAQVVQPSSILTKSALVNPPPYHIIYVNPGTVITYSNRVNPQQVAEYRQKSHLLPSSATSKKSSAASYDVSEIMEVLANTNKTNVTITRNSHRPNPNQASANGAQTGSIYSHSMNVNTPGIVSTQLHHQARSYLDSMKLFYAEEKQRIKEEEERLKNEPSHDEFIDGFLKRFRSALGNRPARPPEVSSGIDLDHERHD